ncbi:zinc metalloprotease [Paracoccus sphaerophysae]|uniref:Zinc metalloprotease n=1 Tax=Paracoccus sphaerophysae TaxID=690417 RepID=A0A099FEE8_9RHOB|nr:zinc metalloprotease [Paracoccus sphaerophysae]
MILDDGTTVTLRRTARARRMTLRVSGRDGAVTLTLPPRLPEAEARAFLSERSAWLKRAMQGVVPAAAVEFGAALPVEGRALVLTPAPVRRPQIDGEALLLPATRPAAATAAAFLRALAQGRLTHASDRHAATLGLSFRAIALRDTRSRWGSCTHDGRLMYSWRLAMAPPPVLDYVAAHEVAHLAHMDHSAQFWRAVAGLCPDYPQHRGWLRQHGGALHRWQFRADSPRGN